MKKISTLFKKNPEDLHCVVNEVNEENDWVIKGEGIATRKFNGTPALIMENEIYKRYDLKEGKTPPDGAIPCQEADAISGYHPHWVKCKREDNANKYFFEAFDYLWSGIMTDDFNPYRFDGTYELCGEKIQGNPEKIKGHKLIRHGYEKLNITDLSFEGIKDFLSKNDIEGIVFHHKTDGRMCKIRKTDFKIKR